MVFAGGGGSVTHSSTLVRRDTVRWASLSLFVGDVSNASNSSTVRLCSLCLCGGPIAM